MTITLIKVVNNALPRSSAVLIITILLTVILAGSPVSSFGVTAVSPSEDLTYIEEIARAYFGPENQEYHLINGVRYEGMVTNSGEQQLFQRSSNTIEDNDVIVGRCYEGGDIVVSDNDEVTQTNIEEADQEANSENESSDEDVTANTIEQASTQIATNTYLDNDLIIIIGCHGGSIEINDNDKVTQVNLQSTNQVANSDDEESDDEESDDEEETDSD